MRWFYTDGTPEGFPRKAETADQAHERHARKNEGFTMVRQWRNWVEPLIAIAMFCFMMAVALITTLR